MLPKEYRLLTKEIKRIFRCKFLKINFKYFSVFLYWGYRTKYAVSISKDTAKKAVRRNRIRRRCMSVLEKYKSYSFDIPLHIFIVINEDIEKSDINFQSLDKDIVELLTLVKDRSYKIKQDFIEKTGRLF